MTRFFLLQVEKICRCSAGVLQVFECFGNDKRKFLIRIKEILNRIIDWSLDARITRTAPVYLDQKKVFYRNVE